MVSTDSNDTGITQLHQGDTSSEVKLVVHNQCSDFELISPAYFGRNVMWHAQPDQKVDVNNETRASIGIDIDKRGPASALIYRLQRKRHLESNDQSNTDNTLTRDTTSIQLLVIWGINYEHGFSMRTLLIKHSITITWNDDTLEKLYSMYLDLLRADHIIENTWLLDNTTVLMTTSKWKEEDHTIEITVSEGARKNDSMDPLYVSTVM
jgi:hypothetical protein